MTRTPGAADPSNGEGLLRCVAGRHEFALRADEVRHVARADQLRPDAAADGRLGAVTLGGRQVPVFGLGKVLGLADLVEAPPHADQHIAVTGDADELVGWLVDRIARAAFPAESSLSPLPASVGGRAASWFEGLVNDAGGEPLLLIAPRQLNPLCPPDARDDTREVFDAPAAAADAPSDPIALVFSTSALPSSVTQRYALSGREVVAISQPSDPIAVPGCAAHVAGLTLWRNAAVPIVDFRDERQRADQTHRRRLIARCGSRGALVALPIDAEIVMHHPAADDRLLPDVPCAPFTTGVFDVDGEAVALLDLPALLSGSSR